MSAGHSVGPLGRLLVVLAALVIAGFAVSGVALAAGSNDYPAGASKGTVDIGSVQAGHDVVFSGQGFTPGESITITMTINGVTTNVATVTADAQGGFSLAIHMTATGMATLGALGQASGHAVSASVTVTAGGGAANGSTTRPDGLARTGAGYDIGTSTWLATAAVALGALLVALATIAKRRRLHALVPAGAPVASDS